jgi:hypothetical protein
MEKFPLDFEPDRELELEERQERCQKAMKIVAKAIAMRLLVFVILILAVIRSGMPLWAAGLMVLVMIINLTGTLPLVAELKKRRQEWKMLLEEEK